MFIFGFATPFFFSSRIIRTRTCVFVVEKYVSQTELNGLMIIPARMCGKKGKQNLIKACTRP